MKKDLLQSCLRKKRYDSWDEAEAAAMRIMSEASDGGGPLMAYACRYGEHWHFGHVIGRSGRRQRKLRISRP